MRHTAYGDLQASFVGDGWSLFKKTWWLWLLLWPSLIIMIPAPFIWAELKAIEWRWWLAGIRFGEVSFTSKMRNGALIDLYWKVIGWWMLLSVALGGWFGAVIAIGVASVHVPSSATEQQKMAIVMQKLPVLFGLGFGYILVALAAGVLLRIYLMRDVWQRVTDTLTVHNLQAADNVTAQGHLVSALGEGFADSLDIAGF